MAYQLMVDSNGQYWRWGVDASAGAGNETPVLVPAAAPVSDSFGSVDVDICNLALSHLGDAAELESLDDDSTQAKLCKRFYTIARNSLLEMFPWSFATMRAALTAADDNPSSSWRYAYAIPTGALKLLAVLPAGAPDDYQASIYDACQYQYPGYGPYSPQPFTVEDDGTGTQIILTNAPDAVLRYSRVIPDATCFTPLFTVALSWLLASMLAGPIIKGDTGAAEAKRCLAMFEMSRGQATVSDANRGSSNVQPVVAWIAGR